MESRRFVIPWLGESKWTPVPHAPPTSLSTSLPTLPNCPPPISPRLYTYIHPPTTFFFPSQCLHSYCIPALPPFLPFFAFFSSFLAIPLLPAPSSIIIHLFPLFSKAFSPLPDPPYSPTPACPPLPPFSLFWTIYGRFLHVFLFHSIYTCTYMIYCIE